MSQRRRAQPSTEAKAPCPSNTQHHYFGSRPREAPAQVGEQGYAVDNEDTEERARSVGAAICSPEGKPLAAISVSGPISHFPKDRISEIAREIKKACRVSKLAPFRGEGGSLVMGATPRAKE